MMHTVTMQPRMNNPGLSIYEVQLDTSRFHCMRD